MDAETHRSDFSPHWMAHPWEAEEGNKMCCDVLLGILEGVQHQSLLSPCPPTSAPGAQRKLLTHVPICTALVVMAEVPGPGLLPGKHGVLFL